MADFPSYADLFRVGRDEILLQNGQLSVATVDRQGTDANILVSAAAAIGDEVIGQLTTTVAGLYLDSANGAALDRLMLDRYGLIRKNAASAVGSVVFSVPTPIVTPFVIPQGSLISTPDGIVYQTTQDETFLAGETQLYCIVSSVLAGFGQNVSIGTLTTLVSRPSLAPSSMTVTNPVATAGGVDQESDSEFRSRGRSFYVNQRRGTLGAIVQGALSVPGVVRANAFETVNTSGQPNGYVSLVIADQYTDSLADLGLNPAQYQAQSKVLAQTVFNALQEYRPAGVFVSVQIAQTVLQPIQLSLSFVAGVNVDVVALAARSAVVTAVNNLNPGDDLTLTVIQDALRSVNGLVPSSIATSVYSPSGSVQTTSLQVIRTTLALVTATSSNPGTPIGGGTNPDQG